MKFLSFFSLSLSLVGLASSSAIPLVTRDAPAVVEAVNTIATNMLTLNTTVAGYNGGALGTITALKIEHQSLVLSRALRDAIDTTSASANFTNSESLNIAAAFIGLQPKIFSTLDTIVLKKPQFDTGLLGLGSLWFLVKANLIQQRDLSAELGHEVEVKLAPLYAALAPKINGAIAAAFDKAVAAYS